MSEKFQGRKKHSVDAKVKTIKKQERVNIEPVAKRQGLFSSLFSKKKQVKTNDKNKF